MQAELASAANLSDAEKTSYIKAVVMQAGEDLRTRFPVLRHQDAIGALILAVSLSGMAGCAALYFYGLLPAWACIPLVAIFASFTHELEHDLIHWMYFRKKPWAHHLMMALVWLARPSTINPWIRRGLHFRHHKHSGTAKDMEEQGVTNGQPWSLRRLVMIGDASAAILFRLPQAHGWKRRAFLLIGGLVAYFPLGWMHWGLWYCFLGFHTANGAAVLMGTTPAWSAGTLHFMQGVDFLTVVLIAPNVLRSFCLHFVTSNMHYFGDIEDGNVMQQCQVLNVWWMLPFQLFCFNFGSTHGIHHFVVKEPFYIRQLTAPVAHKVMREMGVRFNDIGNFSRANRWSMAPSKQTGTVSATA